jgi:hypothetical protein
MSNSLIKKNPCNDTSFDKLLLIPEVTADENLKSNIKEIQILYNNGNFYLSAGEFSGALVSYACAAVLLNSTGRSLPPTISGESDIDPKEFISNMQNCCLNAVEELQPRVKLNKNKGNDDDEQKDWDNICVNYSPLTFSEGSDDCLFFNDVSFFLLLKIKFSSLNFSDSSYWSWLHMVLQVSLPPAERHKCRCLVLIVVSFFLSSLFLVIV